MMDGIIGIVVNIVGVDMKILNLYAGIGGNRKLWGDEHEITAVEYDENIAKYYKESYPKDNVIVTDAHEYLRINYENYDFIWSSPPCPSHSKIRQMVGLKKGAEPIYPDMKLYEEIIFLKHHFKGLWLVENVIPYYKPLIEATKLSRHLFWSNFTINDQEFEEVKIRWSNKISDLENYHKIYIANTKLKEKRQLLRNCVFPKLGKYILDEAIND